MNGIRLGSLPGSVLPVNNDSGLSDSYCLHFQSCFQFCLQGYHSGGIPVAMTGVAKGIIGIAVRPTVGMFELISKGTHGMGLVCLGREAITGSAQRRVRAPGAGVDEQAEVSTASKIPLTLCHLIDSPTNSARKKTALQVSTPC